MRWFVAFLMFALGASAADVDRAAAEWVIHEGGSVVLDGQTRRIWDITELPASDFQLHTINLTGALIPPTELKRLSGLSHLKYLYLSGRTWHGYPVKRTAESLKLLSGLTSLERFIITLPVQAEIPIEDPAIANLAPLVHLQQLRLAQTNIKGRTLAAFTEMRSLDLTNTRIDDQGMRSLQGMTHLEKLYLHDALITDEGLQYIRNLHDLTELDLYDTQITDAGLVNLKELTKLRKLNLLGAAITDTGLDQLAGLTKLTDLNLYRTQITNTGLAKLQGFKDLRELDVRYTRVTRGGLTALSAVNPNCRVQFMDASAGPVETKTAASVTGKGTAVIANWIKSRGGKVVVESGQIRDVSLANTPTTDADLKNLQGLPLRKLDISFTEVGDLGLRNLGLEAKCSLREINVANTTLSDKGLETFEHCDSLEKVGLGYALIHGAGLAKLPSAALRELNLTGLSLTAEGLSNLARFAHLETLDLQYSDIDDTGLAQLQDLSSLTSLDLTGTDLGDAGLKSLRSLTNLSELALSYGRFTDKGLEQIGVLTKLTKLSLVRTRTTDKALPALAGLKNLTSLNLDYTAVSDHGLAYLAQLPNLTQLRLDSATITDAGVETLKAMRQLKSLDLYHTLVTDQGIGALKTALPNCTLLWDRGSNLPTRRGS